MFIITMNHALLLYAYIAFLSISKTETNQPFQLLALSWRSLFDRTEVRFNLTPKFIAGLSLRQETSGDA